MEISKISNCHLTGNLIFFKFPVVSPVHQLSGNLNGNLLVSQENSTSINKWKFKWKSHFEIFSGSLSGNLLVFKENSR
ncbi:hypothetical protein EF876_05595 [Erysipelothrix rhusiopathiae]|nr:hypothetical protein EF876_05595 [Erysipelothrix rhusiopathiae]